MRNYINHIPLVFNIGVIIFMSIVMNGFFESEEYLDFRVSYSKNLLLFFSYALLVSTILGIVLNFKKEKWRYLILFIITLVIYFLLISPFYSKISPW